MYHVRTAVGWSAEYNTGAAVRSSQCLIKIFYLLLINRTTISNCSCTINIQLTYNCSCIIVYTIVAIHIILAIHPSIVESSYWLIILMRLCIDGQEHNRCTWQLTPCYLIRQKWQAWVNRTPTASALLCRALGPFPVDCAACCLLACLCHALSPFAVSCAIFATPIHPGLCILYCMAA